MSASLIGEIVNSCDATTGFNAGNISGDDDFAEGSGALGAKISNTYTEFYTTSLGATAPYNFASGGGEEGYHMIMWFSSKSKLSATSGYRLIVGNGTSRAEWDVPPVTSELKRNGAFVTRVIDLSRNFSRITTGSWTVGGNPAQLSNITQMGGGIQTTVSIMGSFNNGQIDQILIGLGIRLAGGTGGTPDTFEVARAADEDSGIWGWSQARILKGGIYIGPATGSASSIFTSVNETRVFSASPVAAGFYRVEARGAGTEVTISGANISAEDSSVARWDYIVGDTTLSWDDDGSVYSGIRNMILESVANITNVKLNDVSSITHNGANFDGNTIVAANTADGVALITTADPTNIKNCDFTFSDGHAIEITTPGTYTFTGNTFNGYGGTAGSNPTANSGSTDAAIYNNSGGAVTINIAGGGDTPSVRNGAGATTTVNNNTSITLTGLKANTEVRVYTDNAGDNDVVIDGVENSGTSFTFSAAASQVINIMINHLSYLPADIWQLTVPSTDTSIPISQVTDRQYNNP